MYISLHLLAYLEHYIIMTNCAIITYTLFYIIFVIFRKLFDIDRFFICWLQRSLRNHAYTIKEEPHSNSCNLQRYRISTT